MNRNNIWIHIGIAVVLVTLAAVMGQIRRWENSLQSARSTTTDSVRTGPRSVERAVDHGEPEVLVKFKPGVDLDQIRKIAASNNDLIEDEIESVKGLVS